MCGICGVFPLGHQPGPALREGVLELMTDALEHRGPDDRGLVIEAEGALGARRLSIVDLAGGHQPFANETGEIWGAQNGELYNHAAVRRDLEGRGHVFQSRCDTEIIPHLYEEHGPRFAEHLSGKFAVAVLDRRRRRLVLARDRMGVKPLYYAVAGERLVFASELKSLLASGLVDPQPDLEALDVYLTLGYFPAPLTPLVGVAKLPPGTVLVADPSGIRIERYWEYPQPVEAPASLGADRHASELLDLLDEAVRRRLMSDVPVGAMLSGGLDSSLIVALMARHSSAPVETFSVGFTDAAGQNELEPARRVAEHYGCNHHELALSMSDTVDIDRLVWHLDEPVAELSSLGFLAISELARRHVTVALSGQGADELFGGYRKHRVAALIEACDRLPSVGGRSIAALGSRGTPAMRRLAATLRTDSPVARQLAMSGHMDGGLRERLYRGGFADLDGSAVERALAATVDEVGANALASTLHMDAQLALPDLMLHYFDRCSMAHSLEARVPFLDHEVVEYAATIPAALKVRRGETKYVLKLAAKGLVPDWVVRRPKVGFFRGSAAPWLGAQIDGSARRYLLEGDPRVGEFLDVAELRAMVAEDAGAKRPRHTQLLLAVLMLEVWLTSFLPRAAADVATARAAA
jgi:asparagine synthase (glutamine-hydrolysing)